MTRIINAYSKHSKHGSDYYLTEQQTREFLTSDRLLIHVGTIDEKGEPNVHPTWYHFDSSNDRLYVSTERSSKISRNVIMNKIVYFCIDDPNRPYRGVRGKGRISIQDDVNFNLPLFEKIANKYLEGQEKDNYLDNMKQGKYVILEIVPRFYSTWDESKMK